MFFIIKILVSLSEPDILNKIVKENKKTKTIAEMIKKEFIVKIDEETYDNYIFCLVNCKKRLKLSEIRVPGSIQDYPDEVDTKLKSRHFYLKFVSKHEDISSLGTLNLTRRIIVFYNGSDRIATSKKVYSENIKAVFWMNPKELSEKEGSFFEEIKGKLSSQDSHDTPQGGEGTKSVVKSMIKKINEIIERHQKKEEEEKERANDVKVLKENVKVLKKDVKDLKIQMDSVQESLVKIMSAMNIK